MRTRCEPRVARGAERDFDPRAVLRVAMRLPVELIERICAYARLPEDVRWTEVARDWRDARRAMYRNVTIDVYGEVGRRGQPALLLKVDGMLQSPAAQLVRSFELVEHYPNRYFDSPHINAVGGRNVDYDFAQHVGRSLVAVAQACDKLWRLALRGNDHMDPLSWDFGGLQVAQLRTLVVDTVHAVGSDRTDPFGLRICRVALEHFGSTLQGLQFRAFVGPASFRSSRSVPSAALSVLRGRHRQHGRDASCVTVGSGAQPGRVEHQGRQSMPAGTPWPASSPACQYRSVDASAFGRSEQLRAPPDSFCRSWSSHDRIIWYNTAVGNRARSALRRPDADARRRTRPSATAATSHAHRQRTGLGGRRILPDARHRARR